MKVAVLTAIYDNFDTLKELPEQDIDIDPICFTDDPHLVSHTWRVIYFPRPGMHPCRAGKPPKLTPWRCSDAHASVWLDASMIVTSPGSIRGIIERADPWVCFPHRERDCIYEEAAFSLRMAKYASEPLLGQCHAYEDAGHPRHWGLWSCGVMGRIHTNAVMACGEAWQREIDAWSFQDQVSMPFVARAHDLRPSLLPGFYWPGESEFVQFAGSSRH